MKIVSPNPFYRQYELRTEARAALISFNAALDNKQPHGLHTDATQLIMDYLGYKSWSDFLAAHTRQKDSRIDSLLNALCGPHGRTIYQMMLIRLEESKCKDTPQPMQTS